MPHLLCSGQQMHKKCFQHIRSQKPLMFVLLLLSEGHETVSKNRFERFKIFKWNKTSQFL